jgi:hypothetical protein
MWMLYSLFIITADGEKYVLEGTNFYDKQQCLSYAQTNITELSSKLITHLDGIYGQNKYTTLEIGCVEKDGDPMKRVPIVNTQKTKPGTMV